MKDMLAHMTSRTSSALSMFAQDIVIWEYLDQGLVFLNHHIACWRTDYLKREEQTLVAFASMASTAEVVLCLALIAKDMLGWRCRSEATVGRWIAVVRAWCWGTLVQSAYRRSDDLGCQ
jgi:hypothetical protein